jgi:hypothetical protein
MFNILAREPGIRRLLGIDVAWNQKLIRPEKGELQLMNILRLGIPDASFGTVLAWRSPEPRADRPSQGSARARRVCSGTRRDCPLEGAALAPRPPRRASPGFPGKVERIFPRAERLS